MNKKIQSEPIIIQVPNVGESITEVTLANWLKNTGDLVMLDEVVAEIESDKATFEVNATATGIISIIVQAGETVEINTPICSISPQKTTSTDTVQPASTSIEKTDQKKESASPLARKILAEKGIDPNKLQGTGLGGKIIKNDALKAIQPLKKDIEHSICTPHHYRNKHKEKMSTLRKTIAKRLVAVKNNTAMLTTFNEINMEPVMTLRKKYKNAFKEKYEVGLGLMSFFTTAACLALKEWPTLNACIEEDEIIYHDFCDISIAVTTTRGLVVPVIRNAEQMTFHELEKEVIRLATKARENKLTIDEMNHGTFTITNGGIFGSMLSTPIINAPQSAILGMHNIVERPVAINNTVVIQPIMYVALSYDHRIIDGRESVSFLYRIKELLEDPTRLLLDI